MEPFIFVIFGATGDLTKRKIMPALYRLKEKKLLPEDFAVVGVARKNKTHEEFREETKSSLNGFVKFKDPVWDSFKENIYYFQNDFDTEGNYPELKIFLEKLDETHNTKGNRVLYLATMPHHFENIVNNLKRFECIDKKEQRFIRIIIEKPFGSSLVSARDLNEKLKILFHEKEIFRIDHYLGKETVQNLFALRFSNKIFENLWNSENIDHIQITVTESLGIENRGAYYDEYGALKDMIQNHLLQVLSILAMEKPASFDTESIKNEKVRLLNSIKKIDESEIGENIVFGQYTGKDAIRDYTKEPGVSLNSRRETFVAMKLGIENKRWKHTPMYLRTGKALRRKASEIVIYFKDTDINIFTGQKKNVLVIRLQPNEGIYLRFNVKEPGTEFKLQEASMDFCHECLFGLNTPEAYEKLLSDAFNGDNTLFTRWDEVETSWKFITPIAEFWKNSKNKPIYYEAGTWGPKEADMLLDRDSHKWREPM